MKNKLGTDPAPTRSRRRSFAGRRWPACRLATVLALSLLSGTALAGPKGEILYLGEGRYRCTGSASFECQQFNAREAQRQEAIRREQRREEAFRDEQRRRDWEDYIDRLERRAYRAGERPRRRDDEDE